MGNDPKVFRKEMEEKICMLNKEQLKHLVKSGYRRISLIALKELRRRKRNERN